MVGRIGSAGALGAFAFDQPPDRSLLNEMLVGAAGIVPQVHTRPGELDIRWIDQVPVVAEPDTPRWLNIQELVQLSNLAIRTRSGPRLLASATPGVVTTTPFSQQRRAGAGMILNASAAGAGQGARREWDRRQLALCAARPTLVLQRGSAAARSGTARCGIAAAAAGHRRAGGLGGQSSRCRAGDDFALAFRAGLSSARRRARGQHPNTGSIRQRQAPPQRWITTDPADAASNAAAGGGRRQDCRSAPTLPVRRAALRHAAVRPACKGGPNLRRFDRDHPLSRANWAQAVAADLRAQSPAQLQLMQIQGVAPDYPSATAAGEVLLQDLPDGPTLQVTARFRIPHPLGDARDPHFDFFAASLAEIVAPRDEATRRFPLRLPWPLQLEQHIEATLPADFSVPEGKLLIKTSAYRYLREVHLIQGIWHITHSYVVLADHVDEADYPVRAGQWRLSMKALGLRARAHRTAWQSSLLDWLNDRLLIIPGSVVIGDLTRLPGASCDPGSRVFRQLPRSAFHRQGLQHFGQQLPQLAGHQDRNQPRIVPEIQGNAGYQRQRTTKFKHCAPCPQGEFFGEQERHPVVPAQASCAGYAGFQVQTDFAQVQGMACIAHRRLGAIGGNQGSPGVDDERPRGAAVRQPRSPCRCGPSAGSARTARRSCTSVISRRVSTKFIGTCRHWPHHPPRTSRRADLARRARAAPAAQAPARAAHHPPAALRSRICRRPTGKPWEILACDFARRNASGG